MATDIVYKFLRDQNRPFSANDVLENVGKEHGKTAVQKALDSLVRKDKIFEKVYGKQRVYCVVQDENVDRNTITEQVRKMDQEINKISENLKKVQKDLQAKSGELSGLQGKMSTAEAKMKRDDLREEVENLQKRIEAFKANDKPVTSEEKAKITTEHEKYMKEYKKRKRICMDILNSILENYPKTKQNLFEDIGIETDEDVEFKLD